MQAAGPPEPPRRVGILVSANSLLMLAAFGIAGCAAAGVDGQIEHDDGDVGMPGASGVLGADQFAVAVPDLGEEPERLFEARVDGDGDEEEGQEGGVHGGRVARWAAWGRRLLTLAFRMSPRRAGYSSGPKRLHHRGRIPARAVDGRRAGERLHQVGRAIKTNAAPQRDLPSTLVRPPPPDRG